MNARGTAPRAARAPGRRARRTPASAELPTLVTRLAVLLSAGVAPAAAWRFAGEGLAVAGRASAIASSEPAAVPAAIIREARGDPGWRALAAAWAVASESGAPLAEALRGFAELLRGFVEAERQGAVALAGPRATARLVVLMPLVGLAFGALLGQDTLGVLLTTPIGWACLAGGIGLLVAALGWNRRLIAAAAAADPWPGLFAELVALAMRGGVSVERAGRIVLDALARSGVPAEAGPPEAALRLATASGAPVAELLRAEAAEARRTAVAAAATRAERLSVLLLLPLGVCVLPAFVLLGVLPLIVAVVASTIGAVA